MKTIVTIITGLACTVFPVCAQLAGAPDSSFGVNGRLMMDISSGQLNDYFLDAVELPNGMIIMAGGSESGNQMDVALVRLFPDGQLDSAFGYQGISRIDLSLGGYDIAYSIALAQDGDLVLTGETQTLNGQDMFIMKLDTGGNFNTAFNGSGYVVIDMADDQSGRKILVQQDGKILACGVTDVPGGSEGLLVRVNADGTPDNNFSTDGQHVINIGNNGGSSIDDMAILSTGEIFLAGYHNADKGIIVKLNSDGSPDNSFGLNSILEYQNDNTDNTRFTGIAVDASDRILVCGYYDFGQDVASTVLRMLPDGSLDNGWDVNGVFSQYYQVGGQDIYYQDMIFTPEGVLCIGSAGNHFVSVLLDSAGQYVMTFGNNGVSDHESNASFASLAYRAVPISNGRALLAGYFLPSDYDGIAMMIYVAEPPAVGVENIEKVNITVHPNPATQYFSISTDDGTPVKQVALYNMNGQQIIIYTETQPNYIIPAGIPAGQYILDIHTEKGTVRKKLYVFE